MFNAECLNNYRLKKSLINVSKDSLQCYNAISAAELLYNTYVTNIFPKKPFLDPTTRSEIDINQIWYIIVNNNNYIYELNNMSKINDFLNDIELEKIDKTKPFFLYSNMQKEYIESWLTLFKKYNIYITCFNFILTIKVLANNNIKVKNQRIKVKWKYIMEYYVVNQLRLNISHAVILYSR